MNYDFRETRLIFLDVDGVLNSRKTSIFAGKWPGTNTLPKVYYKKTFINTPEGFDKYSIDLVNRLAKSTNSLIVISSNWRSCYNELKYVKDMFEEIGICKELIIGRTDEKYIPPNNRGRQIDRFLKSFKHSKEERDLLVDRGLLDPNFAVDGSVIVDSYAILDDLDGEEILPDQESHLVKTDDYEGLTLRDTIKAGVILSYDIAFGLSKLKNV